MAEDDLYNDVGLLKIDNSKNQASETNVPAWANDMNTRDEQDDEILKKAGLTREQVQHRAVSTNDLGLKKTQNHYVSKTGPVPDQGVDGSMGVRGGTMGTDLHKEVMTSTGIKKGTMKNARATFANHIDKKEIIPNVYLYTFKTESDKGKMTGYRFEVEVQRAEEMELTLDLSNCTNLVFVDGQVKCKKRVPRFTRETVAELKILDPKRGIALKPKIGCKQVKPPDSSGFDMEFDDTGDFQTNGGGPPAMPGKKGKGGPPPAPKKPAGIVAPTKEKIAEKKKKKIGEQKVYETNAKDWDPTGENEVLYEGEKAIVLSVDDDDECMVQLPVEHSKNKKKKGPELKPFVPKKDLVFVNDPANAPPEGYGIELVKAIYDYEPAGDGELRIDPGNIIQVFDRDDSGWWDGLCNTQIGLFPSNYTEKYIPQESDYYVALYAHDAEDSTQLSFKVGEKMLVINKDESGWWEGICKGSTGIFPSNLVLDQASVTEMTKDTETPMTSGEQIIQRDGYQDPELMSEVEGGFTDVIKTKSQAAYTKAIAGFRIDPRSGRRMDVAPNAVFKEWREEEGLDLTAVPAGVRGAYADPTNETLGAGITSNRKLDVRTDYTNPDFVAEAPKQKTAILGDSGRSFESSVHTPDVIQEPGSLIHPLAKLQNAPYPEGVDPKRRELYLSDDDFQATFSMTKEDWANTPAWKKDMKKKAKGLH